MSTLGEVAAAFIGFSMVVGVLRPESDSDMRRFFRMRHVAEIALGAVIAAFLPLLIAAYGAREKTTWFVASALSVVPLAFFAFVNLREAGIVALFEREPAHTVVNAALNLVMIGLLASNVVIAGPSSGARYVTFIVLLLALAGLVFIGATFGGSQKPPAV